MSTQDQTPREEKHLQAPPLAQAVNNLLHTPYISELAQTIYWTVVALFAPLSALALWAFFAYDMVTAAIAAWQMRQEGPVGDRGAVLITGCDAGFGKKLAEDLARKGWKVYAGCLTAGGMAQLSSLGLPSLVPVKMDVTKDADVEAVMALIEEQEKESGGLYCLVNNAGLGRGGSVAWTSLEVYRKIYEVNVFGLVRVCKAAVPLLMRYTALRRHQGKRGGARVVNVSSLAGIAPAQALYSTYNPSKLAVEGITNSLRQEMRSFGVQVTTVNPSKHATPMNTHLMDWLLQEYDGLSDELKRAYGPKYRDHLFAKMQEMIAGVTWEANNVSRALENAVSVPCVSLREQYIVGMDARFILVPVGILPRRMSNWCMRFIMPYYGLVPEAVTNPAGCYKFGEDDKAR